MSDTHDERGGDADLYDWDPVYAAATIDRLQKALATETATCKRWLQRTVEFGKRAGNAEATCEDLREQLAAATARAGKAEALVADAEMRADKFCGAFSDASSLAYRRGKLLDEALTRQTELARERDEARELARASLDILRNVSGEPMRELFEVDDMDEMPAWFTGYGKPSAAVAPDAAQDGRSEPVERSETPGGAFHGNTSSILPQGLSEPEPPRDTSAWCWAPNPHGPLCCERLRDHEPPHRRGERTWTDDTTEDGQHD